jgi:hypothetical protein
LSLDISKPFWTIQFSYNLMQGGALMKENRKSDGSNDGGGGSNSTGYEEVEYIEEVVYEEVEEEVGEAGASEAAQVKPVAQAEPTPGAETHTLTQGLQPSSSHTHGEEHCRNRHPRGAHLTVLMNHALACSARPD